MIIGSSTQHECEIPVMCVVLQISDLIMHKAIHLNHYIVVGKFENIFFSRPFGRRRGIRSVGWPEMGDGWAILLGRGLIRTALSFWLLAFCGLGVSLYSCPVCLMDCSLMFVMAPELWSNSSFLPSKFSILLLILTALSSVSFGSFCWLLWDWSIWHEFCVALSMVLHGEDLAADWDAINGFLTRGFNWSGVAVLLISMNLSFVPAGETPFRLSLSDDGKR